MLVTLRRRNAVVADKRLGKDKDLTTVGRVTEGLWISDKRGGEDGFTRDVGLCTKGLSVEDRTVTDGERGTFDGRWS